MSTINTEQLDKLEEQLNGIITYLDSFNETFNDIASSCGANAQAAINEAADKLSEKINTELDIIRTKIINVFHGQYEKAMEKIAPIEPILSMFPISISLSTGCLTAIVDALTAIKDIIIAPYAPIIEFTTQVIPKVLSLSSKLQTIASYRPSIEIPNVEVPELNISVEPITAGDITG